MGPWVNKTLVKVSDKIIFAVSRGLAGEKTFSPEEEIILDMTGRCSVDATTTPSLAQVLSGALSGFRITVLMNEKNNALLSEAKGYSLIRKSLKILQ